MVDWGYRYGSARPAVSDRVAPVFERMVSVLLQTCLAASTGTTRMQPSASTRTCLRWHASSVEHSRLGRRALREEGNHTQEDLAHDAGITVAALARIERGQANPRWTTIKSIASALGISLGELGDAIERGH